jgi:hypothetical protein
MRGRRILLYITLSLILGSIIIGLLVWLTHGWTPMRVDSLVRGALQPGDSKAKACAWLNTMPFQILPEDQDPSGGITSTAREAGLSPDTIGSYVIADVPDPNVDLVLDGTITVYFFFDHNDLLIQHYIRVWIRSL